MHTHPRSSKARHIGNMMLLGLLQLSPAIAIAALATFDLNGSPRTAPTTMGAFEAATGGIAAPKGLTVSVQRTSG